jgi:hypothetical protein
MILYDSYGFLWYILMDRHGSSWIVMECSRLKAQHREKALAVAWFREVPRVMRIRLSAAQLLGLSTIFNG